MLTARGLGQVLAAEAWYEHRDSTANSRAAVMRISHVGGRSMAGGVLRAPAPEWSTAPAGAVNHPNFAKFRDIIFFQYIFKTGSRPNMATSTPIASRI